MVKRRLRPRRRALKKRRKSHAARRIKSNEVAREFIWEGADRIASIAGKKVLWTAKNWGIHTKEQMESLFNDVEGGAATTTNGQLFCQNFDGTDRFDLEQPYYEREFTQHYTLRNNEPVEISVKIYVCQPKGTMLDSNMKIMDTTLTTASSAVTDDVAATSYYADLMRSIQSGFLDRFENPAWRYTASTADMPVVAPSVGGGADVQYIGNVDDVTLARLGLSLPVGFSIYDSPYFKEQWKVLSTQKFKLKGGQTKHFKIGNFRGSSHKFRDFFQGINQGATATMTGRGHTKNQCYVMFEIQGTLGHTTSATEAFDNTYATATDYTGTSLVTDSVGFLYSALDVHVLSKVVNYVDELLVVRPRKFPYLGIGNGSNLCGGNMANSAVATATEAFNIDTGGVNMTSGLDNTKDATNP